MNRLTRNFFIQSPSHPAIVEPMKPALPDGKQARRTFAVCLQERPYLTIKKEALTAHGPPQGKIPPRNRQTALPSIVTRPVLFSHHCDQNATTSIESIAGEVPATGMATSLLAQIRHLSLTY